MIHKDGRKALGIKNRIAVKGIQIDLIDTSFVYNISATAFTGPEIWLTSRFENV
jgi:hypothetical protein